MDLVVLGGGESGVGAALLARRKGVSVFLSDRSPLAKHYKKELVDAGIDFEEGQHTASKILAAREVVKSPGIPDTVPLVQKLRAKNTPVISEIEFASRYTKATLIAITGTNGKTTTTRLTYHLLNEAGLSVAMGGNVGKSFARLLTESPKDIYVLELSSFQLDGIHQFCPDLSMLLNITPDHLDRYEYQMDRYIASKFRIQMNQGPEDAFLYWKEDPHVRPVLSQLGGPARQIALSTDQLEDSRLNVGGSTFDLKPTALRGQHNAMNAVFALQAALEMGVEPSVLQRALEGFTNAPHRMEPVGTIHGITFINDSKATNVDAVYYALQSMDRPVIWIAGGQDKGNDYEQLLPLVRAKVRILVGLGVDNEKLKTAFEKAVDEFVEVESAHEAVKAALKLGREGEVALLAPACASFDRFKNYEERGDLFRQAVRGENI
jgi:UDP-N-acetylmuramoylalanine--D-glutamate ligase